MPQFAAVAPYALAGAGTLMQAKGTLDAGSAGRRGAYAQASVGEYVAALRESEARNKEIKATQERAASHRRAASEQKNLNRVTSAYLARSAAAGADPGDSGSVDIMADIEDEGAYRILSALYQGNTAASGLEYAARMDRAGAAGDRYAAAVTRQAGDSMRNRSRTAAISGVLQGGASLMGSAYKQGLFSKYGQGGAVDNADYDPDYETDWWDRDYDTFKGSDY